MQIQEEPADVRAQNETRSRETERNLIDASRLSDEQLFEKYQTEPDGLNQVEEKYIEKPKRWDIPGIKKFMIFFGLLSTVLDVLCFLVLWFVFGFSSIDKAGFFQCGWFMFGVISQTMVIHTIRTPKIPFIQDRASRQLTLSTVVVCILTLLIGFTGIALLFSMPVMPISFLAWMACLMVIYTVLAQAMKTVYIRINKEWV